MKSILCFGDSNTYGLIPGTTERYGWGVRWTSIIAEKLAKYDYRVIEEGLCGRTTVFEDSYRKGRRGDELLPLILETNGDVDIVTIMLGTNDCKTLYNATPADIGNGVKSLVRQVRQKLPQSKILLISPIHLGEKVWHREFDPEFDKNSVSVSKRLSEVYKNIATEHGLYFLDAAKYVESSEVDQEHLDSQGHEKLAQEIYYKILDIIVGENINMAS